MTIQRFTDLAKVTVAPYPFQMRREAFQPALDGYTFTQHDVDVLKRAIADPPTIDKLELLLRTRCGFAAERELCWLSWPRIVTIVRAVIDELPAPKSSRESKPPPEELPGKTRAMTVPVPHPTSTGKEMAKKAGVDPDLQGIIDRWPAVPKELRKEILRMIDMKQNRSPADARQMNVPVLGLRKHLRRQGAERKRLPHP